MTDQLPLYSGDTSTCPKCRGGRVDVGYRPHVPTRLTWNDGDVVEIATHGGPPNGGECLLRTCRDCGWAWLEACADAEPTQPATHSAPCPACTASSAACIAKGGRCCAMCFHRPVLHPMRSLG